MLNEKELSRRQLLRCSLVASASLAVLAPSTGLASWGGAYGARKLALHNLHTGEKLSATYVENGYYVPGALEEINYVLRDFRTGEVKTIDPHLLDVVYNVQELMNSCNPVQIISGYRSPKTNAALHAQSSGVAQNSYHIKGQAMDICMEGRTPKQLHQAAVSLRRGGVGYYPDPGFVHVDTGDIRYW